ncbi:hypothetical protein ACLMAJ_29835 [Nocardia sp. KC 131]|uniref:hypothetical protein n=1 Tax=Nocardia arseniciresistens TaxID=3392119 RepID=UPI00398E4BC7
MRSYRPGYAAGVDHSRQVRRGFGVGAINTDILIGTKDSTSWITAEHGYIDGAIEPAHTRL